ncbi:hypothetical protein Pst134EA_004735 [Puccinia striiformis f. sp. tritici]|uniref:hypothetical protein n=1 Tax=Puccinia striiformis f. sp. tritici TaxID=168172 RepID=UPI002008461A|nr:hypothetical protein Pst134EA_004735 [Puccinia striiformis f. sp. tritici]KAH9461893.1 hypothetical protein Pst134EB_005810 [Puccinia striiformis f. sp. tritici]KAH9470816.1 hypothetical protein Pst134EA_004735 [Puccinia striiformis f. sp. tritici]
MLQFYRLISLVLLIAPCRGEDTPPDHYFGCDKNVDAICSARTEDPGQQKLFWAVRLKTGKRHYKCAGNLKSYCCRQGEFNIAGAPNEELTVANDATSDCTLK